MKNNISVMKKYILGLGLLSMAMVSTTSCSDFFETESTHVIYANKSHLNVASDTIYSMIGILNRLQAIGDRTYLLGEVRGDLMDVTENTSSDLRDIAMFNVGDDNMYNVPRDYYAVINNCNYYIANADTTLKNNRNQYLFRAEFAAAKAIRAWTYLQLVTTYGRVPFVTEPILTKEDAEKDYPMYDINQVCDYFLNEDGLYDLIETEYPKYGVIKSQASSFFFIPMALVLGDMNLWKGNYLMAAQCYYIYMRLVNGRSNIAYFPTGIQRVQWMDNSWEGISSSYMSGFQTGGSEIIFSIPGDSIPSEGYYSQLRSLMNSSADNNYKVSLTPSKAIINLSAAQTYCLYNANTYIYAPKNLPDYYNGDLRLAATWSKRDNKVNDAGERYTDQTIYKLTNGNIRMYRRQLVYLRFAEAMNRAGYPRYAYQILSSGLNNKIVSDSVLSVYRSERDSIVLTYFDFPNTRYGIYDPSFLSGTNTNTQGIHSRGSGYSMHNEYYRMPMDTTITDSLAHIKWQIEQVENMIVDEEALEFAFEGYRYSDLLRVALRRYNEGEIDYLEKKIKNRRGGEDTGITVDLTDKHNWFLHWKGQIGY